MFVSEHFWSRSDSLSNLSGVIWTILAQNTPKLGVFANPEHYYWFQRVATAVCAVHTLALAWSRSFPIVKSNLHKHSKDSSSLLFSSLTTQSCMMLSVNICKQHNYSNKAQNNSQLMVTVIDNVSNPGIVLFMQFTLCIYWVENRRKRI